MRKYGLGSLTLSTAFRVPAVPLSFMSREKEKISERKKCPRDTWGRAKRFVPSSRAAIFSLRFSLDELRRKRKESYFQQYEEIESGVLL